VSGSFEISGTQETGILHYTTVRTSKLALLKVADITGHVFHNTGQITDGCVKMQRVPGFILQSKNLLLWGGQFQ
jgi:hypothetical protein